MTGAQIGVFGGSGFYSLLDDAETVEVDTPYGEPSAPPVVGSIGPYRVGFIPRHGVKHQFPPHAINYRANLWAMKELGVADERKDVAAPRLFSHCERDLHRDCV